MFNQIYLKGNLKRQIAYLEEKKVIIFHEINAMNIG